LVKWHEQYAAQGLVIIEINGGKFETRELVRESVIKQQVPHRVLWDKDCQNTQAYEIKAWPTAYLVGRDGRVVWEGNPSRIINRKQEYKKLKELLEKQLKTSNSNS
jgi:glutathione peroxidase-family protein